MRYLVSILTLITVGLLLVACGADATPTPPPPTPTTEAAKPTEKPAEEPTQKPTEPATSQAQTSSSNNKLADTGWALETLNSKPVLTDTIVTLDFGTDGKATGTDGCNNYSAAYTVDGTTIKFEAPMAATMMACPEPIMNQAADYAKALGQATTFDDTRSQLTLSDSSGTQLATFIKQTDSLGGTSWYVASYLNMSQTLTATLADTKLTANFGSDGKLTGSAGCNDYTATFETSGRRDIKISAAAATQKMCEKPEGVMQQEADYLKALQSAATFRGNRHQLELGGAGEKVLVQFLKAESTPSPTPKP